MADDRQEIIGGKNFWLYSKSKGWDITHPPTPESPAIYPRIRLETTTGWVAIDPAKTALIVVDLQNYFLSPALGRSQDAGGMKVVDKLLKDVIPSCRRAKIPVVWLNWGLTEEDIEEMPPTIIKGFAADSISNGQRNIHGPGSDIGHVKLDDGTEVEGGRVLMRDQWNSALYAPLAKTYLPDNDIWVHKNRLSGFWGGTAVEGELRSRGIKTLLFAGVNTDQCVGGSLQDAFTKGWDCLLLSDGTATSSPKFAQQCIEFNTEQGWGFLLSCKQFAEGVDSMQYRPDAEQ